MGDWSLIEVDLVIADYFAMLLAELSGQSFNKTSHRKALLGLIDRNEGSIEFKHQNISAILVRLGLPFIKGYKRRDNYQRLLEERVIEYVTNNKALLEPQFMDFSQSTEIIRPDTLNFTDIIESPPDKVIEPKEPDIEYNRRPIKINYLEREQHNVSLGQSGEKFILEYERWQLIQVGKDALADKIEWIANHDDGAGFDILSKNHDGSDKYIEVKTTKLSKETPIFFTLNEYEFAKQQGSAYHLYRLFNFAKSPKMFMVNGSFDDFCIKRAIQFKGLFS